jgi:hypothetical protein
MKRYRCGRRQTKGPPVTWPAALPSNRTWWHTSPICESTLNGRPGTDHACESQGPFRRAGSVQCRIFHRRVAVQDLRFGRRIFARRRNLAIPIFEAFDGGS